MKKATEALPRAAGDDAFTPDELRVLKHAAENYLTGRRVACFVFRATVAIGALAGAILAGISLLRASGPAVSSALHG